MLPDDPHHASIQFYGYLEPEGEGWRLTTVAGGSEYYDDDGKWYTYRTGTVAIHEGTLIDPAYPTGYYYAECPQCGQSFVLVDDYICYQCRDNDLVRKSIAKEGGKVYGR
jgi:hypothetical protein